MNEISRVECLRRMELVATHIDPVFLNTPQFDCETLGDELGVQFALKVEVLNPIRSFKGRGAELLVAQASNLKPLICASACPTRSDEVRCSVSRMHAMKAARAPRPPAPWTRANSSSRTQSDVTGRSLPDVAIPK